jgi:hypothetical protein
MGIMSSAMGRRLMAKAQARSTEDRMRDQYYADIDRTGQIGRTLTDRFVGDVTSYNPRLAFEESTKAVFDTFHRDLGRNVRGLRASQVGMGRLDTGFATGDEDRLIEGSAEGLHREIAGRGLQAEGLNLDRLGILGAHANAYSDRALEARGGEYQTIRQQRLAEQAQKRSGLGQLLGAGISAVGTIAGGPIGGAIANRWIAPKVAKA